MRQKEILKWSHMNACPQTLGFVLSQGSCQSFPWKLWYHSYSREICPHLAILGGQLPELGVPTVFPPRGGWGGVLTSGEQFLLSCDSAEYAKGTLLLLVLQLCMNSWIRQANARGNPVLSPSSPKDKWERQQWDTNTKPQHQIGATYFLHPSQKKCTYIPIFILPETGKTEFASSSCLLLLLCANCWITVLTILSCNYILGVCLPTK